jgi:signal transduction histidine kinase
MASTSAKDIEDEGIQQDIVDGAQLASLLYDASIDQILALDTSLRVIAWNKACEQATGISKREAIGAIFTQLRPAAAGFPAITEAIEMARKGFKSFVPWEKGSYGGGYFENHFIPLRAEGEDGPVTGVLNIIHDVAHRIKAEKELRMLNRALTSKNKELKQKTEELANFNWIASHDLKEPLRKIYTFIEMVATKEGQKLSDIARSNLRRAQSAVQRMGLLTDDIVTFSQVTAANEQLIEVDLGEVLDAARQKHERTIRDTGAVIDADALPEITGYPELLQHLLYHMLGNALKFCEEGSIPKVRIGYAYVAGKNIHLPEAVMEDNYHCISFKDNGIGFDPMYSEKIFGMFQRLHSQGTYRGTGMGLPICRKIVEAHEGFISVESAEGQGSTFSCYLKDLSGRESTLQSSVMA